MVLIEWKPFQREGSFERGGLQNYLTDVTHKALCQKLLFVIILKEYLNVSINLYPGLLFFDGGLFEGGAFQGGPIRGLIVMMY